MKKTLFLTLLCLLGAGALARADVATDWNLAALNAIRARGTPPPPAARHLAILHVAIYDAVNGILPTHQPYHVRPRRHDGPGGPAARGSREAAAAAAAHRVMSALYPTLQTSHDALLAGQLAGIPNTAHKQRGLNWGAHVAQAILALRANDGSTHTGPFPGSTDPGQWRPHESFDGVVLPALLPLWGQVTPFALMNGAQLRPPPPPALDTADYADEFNFVKLHGATNSPARTADQTEIARFWAYGPGTATPPGHWNQVAHAVLAGRRASLAHHARLFALLNLALADAAIVSWDCKYVYNYWRPITAIPLADTDGNAATEADPLWKPLLFTPPFPEYTSGHSTFSGAAAEVLAGFFKRDRIAFRLGSDDLPGVTRHYRSFSEAAEESGLSRILGGIHFMSANIYGLLSGAETGEYVLRHQLRPLKRGHKFHDDDDD
jgi:hypothetical protein